MIHISWNEFVIKTNTWLGALLSLIGDRSHNTIVDEYSNLYESLSEHTGPTVNDFRVRHNKHPTPKLARSFTVII